MEKEEKHYDYEEWKDYSSDIKLFFESFDLSKLNAEDLSKIDILKDAWINYYFKCVDLSYTGSNRPLQTVNLFKISNSVTDEETRKKFIKFAYDYIIEMRDEDIFDGGEPEKIDELLRTSEFPTLDEYLTFESAAKQLRLDYI